MSSDFGAISNPHQDQLQKMQQRLSRLKRFDVLHQFLRQMWLVFLFPASAPYSLPHTASCL
jgi:hypothetical protein